MIKSRLMEFFFKEELDRLKKQAFNEGSTSARNEREKVMQELDEHKLNRLMGSKGIYIPNEWCDPDFFIITHPEYIGGRRPAYGYKNVLTGEKGYALINTVLPADEKMVEAVLKLNPFERWNMCTSKNTLSNMWSKSYPLGEITDSDTLRKRLKEVNFI